MISLRALQNWFVGLGLSLCLILMVASAFTTRAEAQSLYSPGVIENIAVEGNQRVSDSNIFVLIPIKVGDSFDPIAIDASIKALFATGQFSDVKVGRQGNQLVFQVLENIVLDIIAFEGNETVNDETLTAVISSASREPFTQTRAQNDVRRILQVYQARGLYGVQVTPKLITLDRNRANLVFEIAEGTPAKIDSIVFIGNKQFPDSRLRTEIQSRQRAPWRLFTQDDLYNPERLAIDARRLERFYGERGFADFKVISTSGEQIADRSGFLITFQVDEGRKYNFGTSTIRSEIGGLDGNLMRRHVATRQGQLFDTREINETRSDMTDALGDLGFAFAEVRVERDPDPSTGIINLTYVIEEGQKVFVERIDINGNDRTLDHVIRREFRLQEGDAFSVSKLQRSQQRIGSLGFFSGVDVDTLPGSAPDRTIIDVTVQEDDMNEFQISGTLSTQSGILGNLGVTFGNIGGRGQAFSVNAVGSTTSQDFSMSFSEPWLFDREIPASASISYNQNIDPTETFNTRTFGGRLSAGYKLNETLSQSWSYSLRRSEIFNVQSTAPFLIAQEEGVAWRSILGHRISLDERDNVQRPREGFILSLSNDFAGLGGDVSFLKNVGSATVYFPMFDESSIAVRAEAGNIFGLGQDTRISDRFFFGENIVRGFSPDGLTPRCDASESNGACPNDVALGGTSYYRGTAEYRFPFPLISEQGFSGRAFADVGAVWDVGADTTGLIVLESALPRFSVGVGATWESPFGPLQVDYGFPFNVQEGDVVQNFRFSISGGF